VLNFAPFSIPQASLLNRQTESIASLARFLPILCDISNEGVTSDCDSLIDCEVIHCEEVSLVWAFPPGKNDGKLISEKCIICVLCRQSERLAHEGRLPFTSQEARDTFISDIPGLPSAQPSSGFLRLFIKSCHVQLDEIPSLPARKNKRDPRQYLLRTRKAAHRRNAARSLERPM
jgi:hypothetical protein